MLASSLNMQNTNNVAESSRKHHVFASKSAGCRACFEAAARRSLGIIAATSLIGCDSVDRAASEERTGADAPGVVRIDGSSTVFPISEAVAEEYQKLKRQVRVTVGVSGTGGGFKKLCAGDVDLANAGARARAALHRGDRHAQHAASGAPVRFRRGLLLG
jgi:ABC-type phosphate transport system substrate-binding protein